MLDRALTQHGSRIGELVLGYFQTSLAGLQDAHPG
jgi:hypothetical protein